MDKKAGKGAKPARCRKRQFRGNQHTGDSDTTHTSASARKIAKNDGEFDVVVDDTVRYFIVNFALFIFLQERVSCKTCKSDVKFSRKCEKGLGFKLVMLCQCDDQQCFPSSPMIRQTYDINRRFVFVMRLIGVGFDGIRDFCGFMDFGLSLSKPSYYDILENISLAVTSVTQLVLRKAAKEEQDKNQDAGNVRNHLSVSGDGSWAKRGFTSHVGIVSLIGKYTGKIVDVIVKSNICKACELWAGKEDDVGYDTWHEEHQDECTANHDGSSGKMEVDGVLEMFQRSVELHDVFYKNYIGDGDTKTFKHLKDASPYGEELEMNKLECVLHVKKRMYKRAQNAKKQLTQQKKAQKILENAENVTEKPTPRSKNQRGAAKKKVASAPQIKTAALTNKVMLELSTFYELAIRRHPTSVDAMRNDVWATFYHKISTDENPQHDKCPEGSKSWCKYRVAESTNTLEDFKHPPALAVEVQPALKSIYEDLTTEELLSRCVGANTQNNNESYNSIVWSMAPKHIFNGKKIVELAANCALCRYNEGLKPLLFIIETMGITIGAAASAMATKNTN